MTERILFSVSEENKKQILKIYEEKRKNKSFSAFATQAILNEYERQNQKRIEDFEKPELELDWLPRVNEPLTVELLRKLNKQDPKQPWLLLKMAHWNLSVLQKYVSSFDSNRRAEFDIEQ